MKASNERQTLTQPIAALLMGITVRRLQQMAHDDNAPPQDLNGQYPAREFGEWLRSRETSGLIANGDVIVYEVERARLTKQQADKVELENAVLRGQLVQVDEVAGLWTTAVINSKQKLLSIPTKAAPLVIGNTLAGAKDVLDKLINESLTELAATAPGTMPASGVSQRLASTAEDDGQPVVGRKSKAKSGK